MSTTGYRGLATWDNLAAWLTDAGYALSSAVQPLDSDLTAIAALSTTTFGRALLALADAAAARTALALGTAATAASTDFASAISLTSKADSASPTLTGTPAAPTAAPGTNTTQVATTAFVQAALPTTASGVYTPTLYNVANLDASTAFQCQYLRLGSVVLVSGKVSIDPTLTATSTQLGISLPIASNIGAAEDLGGVAFASGIAAMGAAILGDATNDRAQLQFVSSDITNQAMFMMFSYRVI